MKRPLAAVAVAAILLLAAGMAYGEVPIDVSGSRCEAKKRGHRENPQYCGARTSGHCLGRLPLGCMTRSF
ncbi:MAG: hypothetical protein MZV70_13905 [Desulfobacterales bacterium]|nr:hypothetical protein [Desulfobacterales bacterium]